MLSRDRFFNVYQWCSTVLKAAKLLHTHPIDWRKNTWEPHQNTGTLLLHFVLKMFWMIMMEWIIETMFLERRSAARETNFKVVAHKRNFSDFLTCTYLNPNKVIYSAEKLFLQANCIRNEAIKRFLVIVMALPCLMKY